LKSTRVLNNDKSPFESRTRRIVFVAGPGVEILDLVGPLQVFARASEMHARENPESPPIYSVEVVTVCLHRSLVANCGLRITADKTFREVRGKIDTLLVAGGDAIEQNETKPEAVRWLKRISPRIRRVGSVCTGAMLLARAGLLDERNHTSSARERGPSLPRTPPAVLFLSRDETREAGPARSLAVLSP